MIDLVRIYLLVFGVVAVAGGIAGFARARSRASLIAGIASFALLWTAGLLLFFGRVQVGLVLGLVVCLALAGRFVPGYLRTKKPMPAGLMAALSLIGAALVVMALARR